MIVFLRQHKIKVSIKTVFFLNLTQRSFFATNHSMPYGIRVELKLFVRFVTFQNRLILIPPLFLIENVNSVFK